MYFCSRFDWPLRKNDFADVRQTMTGCNTLDRLAEMGRAADSKQHWRQSSEQMSVVH
jgi:hypothetical protein